MERTFFHIFLNTPAGRENLLQSAYLAERTNPRSLSIFVPTADKCVMYCDHTVVTLDLDDSYLRHPETAKQHVNDALSDFKVTYDFFEPSAFTGGVMPDIHSDWALMTCPRAISQKSGRIGLGHIGPKIRAILAHASFPILIPSGNFKPWDRVTALFGGPGHGENGVQMAAAIADRAKVPLTVLTQLEKSTREECKEALAAINLSNRIKQGNADWRVFETGTLEENLFSITMDSLVVVDSGKHSIIEQVLFGSNLEKIQALLPNQLLICGPNCQSTIEF